MLGNFWAIFPISGNFFLSSNFFNSKTVSQIKTNQTDILSTKCCLFHFFGHSLVYKVNKCTLWSIGSGGDSGDQRLVDVSKVKMADNDDEASSCSSDSKDAEIQLQQAR